MAARTFPVGVASGGMAAYEEQQRNTASAALPAAATERKERSFSLGPFTLRYEEEESVDLSSLARAAAAQLGRVRRFNFAEALQTEAARADLLLAPPTETDPAVAPAGSYSGGALADLAAQAASALENLTYGADGRVRRAQAYVSSRTEISRNASVEAEKSYPAASAAQARKALAAYLEADRAAFSASRTGHLVSGTA